MKDQGEMSIEDRLIYNNNKLVADKIRKTLLNIQNVPGISAKSWIWELIQNAKDVEKTEMQLQKAIPKESWSDMHHALIWHGRKVCSARKPKCEECAVNELCKYNSKKDK